MNGEWPSLRHREGGGLGEDTLSAVTTSIAINGVGRIGRGVLRAAVERSEVEVVAVNDPTPVEQIAHLLRHDSTLGTFPQRVKVADGDLTLGERKVVCSHAETPQAIDWGGRRPGMVIEASGRFTERAAATGHLRDGVERVLISANSRDADALVCFGVNHGDLDGSEVVISASSCTTNCAAAVLAPLAEELGVRRVMLLTVHCYNANQSLVDAAQTDLRRARAAGLNLIPTTTGAAWAVEWVLPDLEGRVSGYAVRVPAAQVSLVDLVVETDRSVDTEGVLAILRAAADSDLAGILTVSEEALVSTDFAGDPHSAVVDSEFVEAEGDRVRLLAWYDNEMGYANRLLDLVEFVGRLEEGKG